MVAVVLAHRVLAPGLRLVWLAAGLTAFSPLLSACSEGDSGDRPQSVAVGEYDATVAQRWFDTLYALVKAGHTAPPHASRQYGYAGVALYESVVHGMAGHPSLVGRLNGLASLPAPTSEVYHWPIAANAALARVVEFFYPDAAATIGGLEQELFADYAAAIHPDVVDRSVQYGRDVATAILAWADGDGFAGLSACSTTFLPPLEPSEGGWSATGTTGTGYGLEPCWGTLRPFVLTAAGDCAAHGAPAFSTDPGSAFYAHALAVYNTTGDQGASLSTDEIAIARFWADGAGDTGTPPGHWMAIVGIVLDQHGLQLDVAAEVYARVGLAVADAFIVCWRQKYVSYLQRPVTYIRTHIDPEWDPLLTTPNFPSYTSGHSTQSGAAAAVLTSYFGPLPFTDTTHARLNRELGLPDRAFTSFLAAGSEAAVSRLYGGIHYIFDNEDGFDQGLCIGAVHDARLR